MFGRPDFSFVGERVAVFVDGCFWHGCPLHANMPGSNKDFWVEKLARNRARDAIVTKTLRRMGWRVVRVWEHEMRDPRKALARIRRALGSSTAQDRGSRIAVAAEAKP